MAGWREDVLGKWLVKHGLCPLARHTADIAGCVAQLCLLHAQGGYWGITGPVNTQSQGLGVSWLKESRKCIFSVKETVGIK